MVVVVKWCRQLPRRPGDTFLGKHTPHLPRADGPLEVEQVETGQAALVIDNAALDTQRSQAAKGLVESRCHGQCR